MEEKRKCRVGICCMDAKGRSKPMTAILQRLNSNREFEIIFFTERVILDEPIELWPEVDCLIGFFSTGYPLMKVIEYTRLHPTMLTVNDMESQFILLDRRQVYWVLRRNAIPTTRHLFMNRDGFDKQGVLVEDTDWIEIDGVRLNKPFVEKPVSGEDHNIYIYYHSSQGGGSTRLFRKVNNQSSKRYPDVSTVRTDGSYVYEEFVATDNKEDTKMYTVGPQFCHCEARKAPVVDGKVLRDSEGKEIRKIIELSSEEKFTAFKVVRAFNQRVCGFDMLKSGGKHYICDVNGWSFVKGNPTFYDQCSTILRELFLHSMRSKGLTILKEIEGVRKLRGIIGVFRHADRTPKQKIKMKVTNKDFLSLFQNPREQVKMKNDSSYKELEQLQDVVKQMIGKLAGEGTAELDGIDSKDYFKLDLLLTVLRGGFSGTKIQLKPVKHFVDDAGNEQVQQALFVCKWGGVVTHSGIKQARQLGQMFNRHILPKARAQEFCDNTQVFSNNERRVKRTAEEFAKGYLDLDVLPFKYVQDTKETARLLGDISAGKGLMDQMKQKLYKMMHSENPREYVDISVSGLKRIGNPLRTMREISALMKDLLEHLKTDSRFCEGETYAMAKQRWERLFANFYDAEKDQFDTTKIPDIFDYITYDVIHNRDEALFGYDQFPLFQKAEAMARFIVPEEYGVEPKDKFCIGSLICEPLVRKIFEDLTSITQDSSGSSHSRFYFSSESHLQTLRNVLLHSEMTKFFPLSENAWQLNYLTHLVFKIFENMQEDPESENRFQVEVLFSSGSHDPLGIVNAEHREKIKPMICIHNNLPLSVFKQILDKTAARKEEIVKKD